MPTTTNGSGLSQNTPTPTPAPTAPTSTTTPKAKSKSKNKKWAKVNLNNIAPMAIPCIPIPQRKKGEREQPFGLLIEEKDKQQKPCGPHRNKGLHRGVNVDGESLFEIEDRLKRVQLEKARKPLTEFSIFPTLAAELRFKIWNFAARATPRILKLVLHPDFPCPPNCDPESGYTLEPADLRCYNHMTYRISNPGQVVPGILQANRESRAEAQLVFEKRYINNYPAEYPYRENDERPWTWYNPYTDIIFFGEDTCIRTVVDFFHRKSDEKYPKVAFRCGNMIGTCKNKCDFDTWEYPHGDDDYACSIGAGIGGGGVGILGVLHGKDEDIAHNTLVPGAPHVEEVFFVVKTECMKFDTGVMPNDLTFRPAIHNGLLDRKEARLVLREGFIMFAWDLVPTKDIGTLIYRNNEFLTELANKTKVDIVPSDKAYVGQKKREIGLYNGTEEGIEKAKEEIKKQLLVNFEAYRRGPNHQGTGQARGGYRGRRGRGGQGGRGQ
ncbi:hypothetical protein OCU04_001296 [Sclerotinia nivalis]|uniref:Uncharacterized protein n=1 Tax=Sclerotinia nivalis TaxID=352851 RepID=A0A9X0DRU0_9HELO|nr:hypothetical protein OCU04_001296 [Sclerotinia nivalis]